MTTLTDFSAARSNNSVLDTLQSLKASFIAWRVEQRKRATIASELATYSNRELFDLGIQSADIPAIVNGTYSR